MLWTAQMVKIALCKGQNLPYLGVRSIKQPQIGMITNYYKELKRPITRAILALLHG